jgi:hypothetical protein
MNEYHTYIADADTNVAYDATTASGPKPASSKQSKLHVTLSAHYLSYHDAQKTRMGSPYGRWPVVLLAEVIHLVQEPMSKQFKG